MAAASASAAAARAGRKALFLDRDGTLIVDKHYLADPAGVELITGVADALRRARELGYLLFMLTNQSGIGRGLFTIDTVQRVNTRMEELLGLATREAAGSPRASPLFVEVCIAPEAPDQPSLYRKPSPRFITEMIAKHRLDPAVCWMIGDKVIDAQTGLNAGIRAALVRTGKPTDQASADAAAQLGVPSFADLSAFVATLR
jgi:D-glycero-D-manno-heptose 1,7-bisphosphate phosphatase